MAVTKEWISGLDLVAVQRLEAEMKAVLGYVTAAREHRRAGDYELQQLQQETAAAVYEASLRFPDAVSWGE